jgi:hypothetical protein
MNQYLDRQVELRNSAWAEAKSLLDHAATESRNLSGEEQAQYDRIVGDIDRYDESIQRFRADAEREQRASEARIDVPWLLSRRLLRTTTTCSVAFLRASVAVTRSSVVALPR